MTPGKVYGWTHFALINVDILDFRKSMQLNRKKVKSEKLWFIRVT